MSEPTVSTNDPQAAARRANRKAFLDAVAGVWATSVAVRLTLVPAICAALAVFAFWPVSRYRLGPATVEVFVQSNLRQLTIVVQLLHEETASIPVGDGSRLHLFLTDPDGSFYREIDKTLGMINERTIVDYWDRPIRMEFDGAVFTATSAGPDGTFATSDDIRVSHDVMKR